MKANFTFKTVAGISLLSVFLLIAGCSKEKNQAGNPNTTNINSPYYLTGLLGTEKIVISGPSNPYVDTVTILVDSNGHQCFGQGQNPQNQITQYVTGATWATGTPAYPANASNTQGSIQILKKLSVRIFVAPISQAPSAILYPLLTPGEVSFADNNDPNDGVIISVRDNNGVMWTSLGDQTGSVFQINTTGQNMGTYAIISGTVNAKMYDGHGNEKQLTSTAFNAMLGL